MVPRYHPRPYVGYGLVPLEGRLGDWLPLGDERYGDWLPLDDERYGDWLPLVDERYGDWLPLGDERYGDWLPLDDERYGDWLGVICRDSGERGASGASCFWLGVHPSGVGGACAHTSCWKRVVLGGKGPPWTRTGLTERASSHATSSESSRL